MTEESNQTNNEETQPPVDQDAPSTTEATTPETTDVDTSNEVSNTASNEASSTASNEASSTASNEASSTASNEASSTASNEPPRDPNTIYVGKKRVMNYVLACMTVLQSGSDTVSIKARGRSISTAVDVSQILLRRFTQGITVKSISIATEKVPNRETNELSNVSSIEIEMGK
jgi:DNA-binding protein